MKKYIIALFVMLLASCESKVIEKILMCNVQGIVMDSVEYRFDDDRKRFILSEGDREFSIDAIWCVEVKQERKVENE